MPVDRNRSRLVWSVLTYHPRTYTHSASAVMQQPVCILYHIIRAVSRTPVSWQVAKYDSRLKYQNLYNEFISFFFFLIGAQFVFATFATRGMQESDSEILIALVSVHVTS